MQKIVMAWSESGGETKSTLAVHLAAGLAIRGKSVALIDLDPQGTATLHCGFPEESIGDCVGSAGLIKGRKTQTL
ncbi:MAG: ParA family protein, partial [Planctomycetota bacterium]|nr:ParA family protein [Planctomycetota bacterium]